MQGDLLDRLKAGDPRAQRELRDRFLPCLASACARVLGDPVLAREVAEDVLTDVMLGHVQKVRKEASLPAYLRMIAVRRCVRLRKASSRHQTIEEHPDPAENPEASLLSADEERGRRDRIGRCMGQLRPRVRGVLRMRFHHEQTQESIGQILGVSKQYVGRVLAKALEDLKRCLEAAHD